ncbi:helix-turn-helix domain-containing protein [Paenibacillus doosanensis]|uniref:HTH-type transcriptional regulator YesS n=1 Tax=Paenibacillus konkukensis TaxID=2020716 RepID=A0ABY4RV49_9BACL|nr:MULTISPECIES: helix-turn-helix domain-containing protein [Paenibacillus]MCS7460336.1 helix-turn-helix domain-containing protein [Paenibacillus doosanensis]UQZ86118.1 HTH-type transcriptional regulator YesS [Paenibacillus konkukensis]
MYQAQPKKTSLFVTILISFLVIVLLFFALDMVAFVFFKSKYQDELIRYNRLTLQNTAERYNTHFNRIKSVLYQSYNDTDVVGFNRQLLTKDENDIDYLQGKKIIGLLRAEVFNPQLYLDNMIVYYNSKSMTFDKDGSSQAEDQYNLLYTSEQYPFDSWSKQLAESPNFSILPVSDFYTGWNVPEKKSLLPISFKLPDSNYMITAFMDIAKAQEAFFDDTDNARRFMIIDKNGTALYPAAGEWSSGDLPAFSPGSNYVLEDGYYYFKETDADGITYVTTVPNAAIASQLNRLMVTLLVLFILSLALGIAVSFYYSKRINRPVKQLISSIVNGSSSELMKAASSISEFAFIHNKIMDLVKEKNVIQSELSSKQSILKSYNYINKLKSINTDISEWKDFMAAEESFTIVLYLLRFRSGPFDDNLIKKERAAYYFREHIALIFSERFPGCHTFQMEKNQILTVITGRQEKEQIAEVLRELKIVFDRDKDYSLFTVAVSSWFEHSTQFNHAYRQVLEMVKQAKLEEETQIMLENRAVPSASTLSPAQDQELNARLQAGDESGSLELVVRFLDDMYAKEASITQFASFAGWLEAKIWKFMDLYGIGPGASWPLKPLMQQLKECCTLEEYKKTCRDILKLVAALISEKKEESDPIVTFVMDHLHTKYGDDLSLDYLADKLNMSSAYLSVYIKEKTGVNFSDHLNDIRIRKAQELLAGTDSSINDVSVQIGYRNITSFNRMFKKWTGMTPSEYRRSAMVAQR